MDNQWHDRIGEPPGYAAVSQRLSEIGHSIAEIRGFLERLVRVEERSLASNQNMVRIEAHMAALDARLVKVESSSSHSGWVVGGVERFIWMAIAAVAAWFGSRQ